jgi:ketosteroid isomerase-like protein
MSRENVEIVRAAIDAFNSETEDWVEFWDSAGELHDPPDWIDRTVHSGHLGIRRAAGLWRENFSEFRWNIERLVDAGDRVVALVDQCGHIKHGGGTVDHPVGALYHLREGKIVRLYIYLSWAKALEAAGLSE